MPTLIAEPHLEQMLQAERQAKGLDLHDEVWEGTYFMPPSPNNDHQFLLGKIVVVFDHAIDKPGLGRVCPAANISDRTGSDWTGNFRVPDVSVFLNGCPAVDCQTYWQGGPSFIVEIISEGDQSRHKLPFYAKVGVREALYIDRDPWQLELYTLQNDQMVLSKRIAPGDGQSISPESLPLDFKLIPGGARPQIEVALRGKPERWIV